MGPSGTCVGRQQVLEFCGAVEPICSRTAECEEFRLLCILINWLVSGVCILLPFFSFQRSFSQG